MPNEIDSNDLRKRVKEYEGVPLEFGLHPILRGLTLALDRIEELEQRLRIAADPDSEELERLRGEPRVLVLDMTAANERALAEVSAERNRLVIERDALKERLERVREWAEANDGSMRFKSEYAAELRAIIEGKEGADEAAHPCPHCNGTKAVTWVHDDGGTLSGPCTVCQRVTLREG